MKNDFASTIFGVVRSIKRASALQLAVLLCSLVFLLTGCQQPGETTAHGNRRHLRNLNINQENLMSELDRALLFDQPSKLTPMRISPEIDD
jgi:hypothetical protein